MSSPPQTPTTPLPYPRHPRADGAEDLVGDGPGLRRHLVSGDPLPPLAPDHHRDAPHRGRGRVGQIDAGEVHVHPPDNWAATASNEQAAAVGEGARQAVAVANPDHPHAGGAATAEGPAVAHRRPRGQVAHPHHSRLQGQDRLQIYRAVAVQAEPRAHHVEMGGGKMDHAGGVRQVQRDRPEARRRQPRPKGGKGVDLLAGEGTLLVRARQVAHHPRQAQIRSVVQARQRRLQVGRIQPQPPHPRVHLQVDPHRPAGAPCRRLQGSELRQVTHHHL